MKIAVCLAVCLSAGTLAFSQSAQWFNQGGTSGGSPAGVGNAGNAPAAGRQQSTSASVNAPTGGFFESATSERMADRIFDTNKDSLDFENGTLNWKGKTFNVGNSRLVRARFERYLSMPATDQNFDKYKAIIDDITASLSAENDRLPDAALRAAWDKLFDAAQYDVDGGSSITIANLVYQSWRMRNEFKTAKLEESEQEAAQKQAKFEAREMANFLEYANDKLKQANPSARNKNTIVRTQGVSDLSYRTQDLTAETAKLAAKQSATSAVATTTVLQFQSQIASFLFERKFQQAQIASMFYRHIYRGSQQNLQVGLEQIQTLMPVSSFTPVVGTFENVATEARKDVSDGMRSVETLYNVGERYGALERLMETFALGEFDPQLAVFPYEKRKTLHKIYRDISALKSLADSRDWGAMEKILEEFQTIAPDFPAKEALAKIRAAERVSDMHVMEAKQAAALGKVEEVKKSLTAAMEAWPLNPAIQTFNSELLGMATGAAQYVSKFDGFIARKNYREIAAEAAEYALAFRKDAARAEQLKKIVVRVSQIDMLIAQAEEFEKQNNKYFAWDILEQARAIDGDDPKLALALARLAPEVSDYVKLLSRAAEAEKTESYAVALNCYLAAQEIFPASRQCRVGIERVAPLYTK